MKRDDLIGFYFGGNKVRIYEYIMSEVIKKDVEKLITFGSIHSNHVRITAAIAAHFNLDCDIIVLIEDGQDIPQLEGNSLLLEFIGVNIYFCKIQKAKEYIDDYLEYQKNKGIKYFFVPGGGHLPIGALGYVDALYEIQTQCKQQNIKIDAIFTPTGTGTTQAGLIYGKKLLKFSVDIVGVTVARNIMRCKEEIINMLDALNDLTGYSITFESSDINILDNGSKKYGLIDEEIIEIMRKVTKSDSVLLDPIYNAKSFLVMEKILKNSNDYKNVIYLNTGGSPNIFTDKVCRQVGRK
jgi:1-aminocyclopropane-1-carboxylate deaminase/D-cysteine desulfhydrase-like pyridoxal-dependent ACC family enzyme